MERFGCGCGEVGVTGWLSRKLRGLSGARMLPLLLRVGRIVENGLPSHLLGVPAAGAHARRMCYVYGIMWRGLSSRAPSSQRSSSGK
jgi:hypothetical protein